MFLYIIIAILRLHNTIVLSKFNEIFSMFFKHVFQKFQGDIFPTQFLFASVTITIKHIKIIGTNSTKYKNRKYHLLRLIARLVKLVKYRNFLNILTLRNESK